MSTDEMPAGRELDAMVAQAMGWTQINKSSGKLMGVPPNTMNRTTQIKVPLFSTGGISTAWPVWEWLPRKLHAADAFALEVSLSDCPSWRYDADPERVYIVIAKWHGETQYSGAASTPELAICRAALRAIPE